LTNKQEKRYLTIILLFLEDQITTWQHYQHRAKGHYCANMPATLSIL
jgi:hypothetical protein